MDRLKQSLPRETFGASVKYSTKTGARESSIVLSISRKLIFLIRFEFCRRYATDDSLYERRKFKQEESTLTSKREFRNLFTNDSTLVVRILKILGFARVIFQSLVSLVGI